MKKISLKDLSSFEGQLLSKEQMKTVMGGDPGGIDDGSGTGCATTTSDPICGGNCQRSGGAADKCNVNSKKECTCGGV